MGMIAVVVEKRADCSAIKYLFSDFCLEGFPLSLMVWDRLYHFIVAFLWLSI